MATESEELKLTVTLDDKASEQLASLRAQLASMSASVSSAGGNIGSRSNDAAKAVKGLHTELTGMAGRAGFIGGVIGGITSEFTKLGISIVQRASDIEGLSRSMVKMSQSATEMGASSAQLRSNIQVFREVGITAEAAEKTLAGFGDAMADLTLINGRLRSELLTGGFLDLQKMQQTLARSDAAKTVEDQAKIWRQAAHEVRDYWTAMAGPQEGARRERQFLQAIGAPDLARLRRELEGIAGWQRALFDERDKAAAKYLEVTEQTNYAYARIAESAGAILIDLANATGASELWKNAVTGVADQLERSHYLMQLPADKRAAEYQKGLTEKGKELSKGVQGDTPETYGQQRFNIIMNRLFETIYGKDWKGEGAPGTTPQRFTGGGAAGAGGRFTPDPDFLAGSPESTNIEDRRALTEDNTDQLKELTDQLKELNATMAYGFLDTQMGGLAPGLGRGGGRAGGGAGAGGGMGALPGMVGVGGGDFGGYGGGGGRGGGGGGGGGQPNDSGTPSGTPGTGTGGTPGVPSGTGALYSPTGSGAPLSGLQWPGGDQVKPSAGTADKTAWPGSPVSGGNVGGGGAGWLAEQRASRIGEINANPALKSEVLGMLRKESGETGAGMTASFEALLNRSTMVGNTIDKELHSGFYSTVKSGAARAAGGLGGGAEKAFEAAAAGSNLIQGRTDQGMRGDPNWQGPGRVPVAGTNEIYNFWKGTRGGKQYTHETSRAFAEQFQKAYEGAGTDSKYAPQTITQGGGAVTHSGTGKMVPEELRSQMEYAGLVAGVRTDIAHGMEPGHARHREGAPSGDVDFYDPVSGQKLDVRNPKDQAKMASYVEAASAAGATGIGFGKDGSYMGFSRMHVGGGTTATWGAGGSGATSPDWLKEAHARGLSRRMTPEQRQAAIQSLRARDTSGPPATGAPSAVANALDWSTGRQLDKTPSVNVNGSGKLDVNVNAPNGTNVKAEGSGLFKKTEITRQTQMEPAQKGPTHSANADEE